MSQSKSPDARVTTTNGEPHVVTDCHVWRPKNTPASKMEQMRQTFKEAMSSYYDGWDDVYDQHFDHRSVWLELVNDPESAPLATCRLIFQRYGSVVGPLPMEMGDTSAYAPQNGRTVVEGSGFWYSRRVYGLALLGRVMQFLLQNEVDLGYILYDPRRAELRKLYLDTLALTPVQDARVVFASFTRRSSGEPVDWHVAVGTPRDFARAHQRLTATTASI